MSGYVIFKIPSAIGSIIAVVHLRSERLHLWAGLVGVAAAALLASYTWSWPLPVQWLAWLAMAATTTVGMGKAVRRELERKLGPKRSD